jgi:hypothetical protein
LDGSTRGGQIYVQRDSSTTTANMLFATNGGAGIIERMRITSAGNVGIGTTVPTSPLTIAKTLSANQTYLNFDNVTNTKYNWGINWSVLGATNVNVAKIEAIYPSDDNIGLAFSTYGSGGLGERVRINKEGNVGIGTTSPTAKLTIVKASHTSTLGASSVLQISDTSASGEAVGDRAEINFYTNSDSLGGNLQHATIGIIKTSTTGNETADLYFGTSSIGGSPVERMRITSGGNVGIGTTSASYKLDVLGSAADWAGHFKSSAGSQPDVYICDGGGNGGISINTRNTSASYNALLVSNGTNYLLTVKNDGQIVMNNEVFNTNTSGTTRTLFIGNGNFNIGGVSSIRASKKNIENVLNVDWLYQLNPVNFNYRKKDEDGSYTEEIYEELNYGLIAEDTAPIADFLINYNDKEDGTKEMIGIEYSRLISPMLKAIQELKAEIDLLKGIAPIEPNNNLE